MCSRSGPSNRQEIFRSGGGRREKKRKEGGSKTVAKAARGEKG